MTSTTRTSQAPATTGDGPDHGSSAGLRLLAALAGVLAAAAAVGAAELAAGALGLTSIIVSIGEGVIQLVPPVVAEAAIQAIGGLNRPALITGTLVILGIVSIAIGLLALRRFALGAAGVVILGLIGVAASIANPVDMLPAALVPGLAAAVAGVAALWWLTPGRTAERTTLERTGPGGGDLLVDRRGFLRRAGIVSVVAAAAVASGRWLQERAGAAAERLELVLPGSDVPADPLPSGVDFEVDGLSPFVTPNDDFYRIDTAVQVPQVRAADWQLRIHGMVGEEVVLTWDDLTGGRYELVEVDLTLTCVSNEVGGNLVGNARWLGVRLSDVLADVSIDDASDQLVPRSVDGYTGGFPVELARNEPDALLAIGMNGEPLPSIHGYPVRLVVPGVYGYVSAVKWLAELEFTTFDAFDQYWVQRNWAERAPIKTQSRIDVPRSLQPVEAGEVVIAGVAWAQGRGIERVEVQVGEDDWQEAELAEAPTDITWRQWRLRAELDPGITRVRVRATDSEGETQDEERVAPIPDGAEGWHTVQVRAE